jgi:small subunit ribosomal protein S8
LVFVGFVLGNWQIKVLFQELKKAAGKPMDAVTDMLNRIRNAQAVLHPTVDVPFSNLKYEIAKILVKHGFIEKVERKGKKAKKYLEIVLKYQDKKPAISGLKKISKPGQRIYLNSLKIGKVRGGYGLSIISTSKGLMTGREAKKQKLGGEVLCEIW